MVPQLFLVRPFLFLLNVTAIDIEPVREEPANPEMGDHEISTYIEK